MFAKQSCNVNRSISSSKKEGDPNHPVLAHATNQAAVAHNLAVEGSNDWVLPKVCCSGSLT
jgi:hypothetical protein